MEERLSDAFEAILEALQDGQTLESLLAEYPDLADELLPLLESALIVPKARANRAEVQLMRSRLDSAFDSQLAAMQIPKRQSRRPLLALVASLGLVICGIWFFLPRGENPSAEEIQLTQSQLEASETAIISASPTSSPTETITESQIPPSSTAAPSSDSNQATDCNPRSDWETYIIQAGDTLSQIAIDSGSSVDELMQANCLTDARSLIVGQRLYVPRLWEDDETDDSSSNNNNSGASNNAPSNDNSGSSNDDDDERDDDDADDDDADDDD